MSTFFLAPELMPLIEEASARASAVLEQTGCHLRLYDLAGLAADTGTIDGYGPPSALRQHMLGLRSSLGGEAFSFIIQGLLAQRIAWFAEGQLSFRFTTRVRVHYARSFQRILSHPASDWVWDDRFFKDLALTTGRLFPAGERVVEPASVLQRSLFFQGNIGQGWRLLQTLRVLGGRSPLFRLHLHLSERASLGIQAWTETCADIAEMLLVNPTILGIVGASWFYDPAMPRISPHLAFINEVLRKGGAQWFFSHVEGEGSGALLRSRTRRRAYEDRAYVPRCYVVVWPRVEAQRWLTQQGDVR